MKRLSLIKLKLCVLLSICSIAAGAQVKQYNLQQLLKAGRLITVPAHQTQVLEGAKQGAITTKGIIWIKGINFKNGTVDIDLRGKNEFLKSFLGIAFRGTDTTTCDILYFRPFNFKHVDTARHKWSVAYMHIPDNDYAKLRKEHPGVYENKVTPVPDMDAWFHATIVIKGDLLTVYVNHSTTPSLTVTMLSDRKDGLFGLYSDGLTNDFANLEISD
ncbi:DUF1080 domain-containing protein [Mucilaginibacter dorajii]|nr:DUF1080 domain-containing protein [Mucilaginibacter dorajii]MCS3735625.1 hypothetical protein [Mucilaginibacter dorajii]